MKIRHKRTGAEIEGRFQEERGGTPCYFVPGELTPYFKCEWEEVKPAQSTWRDVTAECEVEDSSTKGLCIFHNGVDVLWAGGYRLTKISGPLTPHVAFIVEKRE